MDDATQKLVDEVMAYAQREGLTERGIAQAAVRMTLEAAQRGDYHEGLEEGIKIGQAQRPTIGPEVQGDAVAPIRRALHPNATRNLPLANEYANHIMDALLARFALPELDPEKVADANLCGDWPAPCNCDDPDTHDLTKNGDAK